MVLQAGRVQVSVIGPVYILSAARGLYHSFLFQARIRSEEVARQLLVQHHGLQQQQRCRGSGTLQEEQPSVTSKSETHKHTHVCVSVSIVTLH